jgi:membrane-bound lytic murein transglycosylase B
VARSAGVRGPRARLEAEYGVPARYLVALWGLETNFGDYMGTWPVVGALATLAHDPRRSDLFREQLLAALRIIDEGHQDPDGLVGSWAGATGHVQLMPSTFLAYAVDYDGDGRKNVWSSPAEARGRAAPKQGGETWGRQVSLPGDLESAAAELRRRRLLSEWQARGVRRSDGGDLPDAPMRGSIVLPKRNAEPAFLVYGNYRAFLEWNRSTFFAISVGTLADAVTGAGTFRSCGS